MEKVTSFINNYRYLTLMLLFYISSFVGIVLVFMGHASGWWLLAGLVWSKIFQFFGHSIGMHRYFTHRAFKTNKFWHQVMCWSSLLLGTGSPIAYSRNHRLHHKVVDTPDDLHSPTNDGIVKTFLGRWEFHSLDWFMSRKTVIVRDWVKDPTCRFIDRQYYRLWSALIIVSFLVDWRIGLYMVMFPAFIYHVELNIFVNTVGHTWGYRNFKTKDTSTNNRWVSWWTLGEGLHNNHHAHARLYDFAVTKTEFDPSGWFIDRFMLADPEDRKTGVMRIDNISPKI